MKKLLSIALLSSLFPLPFSLFAMPLQWDCDFPKAAAKTFFIYQGETVTFEPTFRVNGKTVDLDIEAVYIQTNGMAELWWSLPNNTFAPTNDVGAASYRFFIQAAALEGGKNYHANGTLRMLPSPGFVPNALPLPIHTLDFSQVEVKNAPWPDGTKVDEALEVISDVATLIYGDDCQLVSTNYNSATKIPSLFLRFKIKNEETGEMEWYKVWDELTRWDYLFDTYLPTNYMSKSEVREELDQKADRAWGYYDSTTGNYAPEGFTWVSSPSIAIAGGLAYQRIVTTEGSVWVLESNGMTTFTGGETNGYFRISDDKGNAIFEITKGTEKVVGATAGAVRQERIMGVTHLFITYNVQSTEPPKLEICRDLKAKDWKLQNDEGCAANVTWTGSSGAWIAEVWGKQPETRLFIQGTYKQGAKDIIKNAAPVAFTEIVVGGVTYKCKVETISGKKVLVLE